MPAPDRPPLVLCGLPFSTADLTLASACAEAQGLQLAIRLDHGTEGEEYEDVLAFSKLGTRGCSWSIWRNVEVVFLQPLIGRARQYRTLADALEALPSKRVAALTSIKAVDWPRQGPSGQAAAKRKGVAEVAE